MSACFDQTKSFLISKQILKQNVKAHYVNQGIQIFCVAESLRSGALQTLERLLYSGLLNVQKLAHGRPVSVPSKFKPTNPEFAGQLPPLYWPPRLWPELSSVLKSGCNYCCQKWAKLFTLPILSLLGLHWQVHREKSLQSLSLPMSLHSLPLSHHLCKMLLGASLQLCTVCVFNDSCLQIHSSQHLQTIIKVFIFNHLSWKSQFNFIIFPVIQMN